jgi:hypothetical protein
MKERPIVRGSSARLNSRDVTGHVKTHVEIHGETTVWHRIIAAITNPDFQAVLAFCLIGFLLALNLMMRFPDLGAVIEQYNQF